uniref:Glucosyltransferase-10-like n=1 Tax=Oryza sativa subsp. japonica TaxID=39947 RepID=Q67W02_ORYSJ|nr:glucosyltransferase-10-like [Oryza sativa Japonica Group]BAD37667.1 glucosyltransferase-10-like [Oryza sativa Japonica Group]
MAPAPATLPNAAARRPHALLVPFPSSGFINPMFHFARLLRSAGFVVTFVNTERNHALMLSRGRKRDGDGIRYEAIPDGLSPPERGAQDDYGFGLLHAVRANGPGHLRELIARLNTGRGGGAGDSPPPPVTCVVASELMSFALDVAAELGVAAYMLWGTSACGLAVRELRRRGYVPLKETQVNAGAHNPLAPYEHL